MACHCTPAQPRFLPHARCRPAVALGRARGTHCQLIGMIVSTDQQAFSVTILVKAEEEEVVKVKQEEEVEMMEARGHEGLVLEGLAGLREQGLLLDTRLWAESQSFQVNQKTCLLLIELAN